jgi:hypothetical protein
MLEDIEPICIIRAFLKCSQAGDYAQHTLFGTILACIEAFLITSCFFCHCDLPL